MTLPDGSALRDHIALILLDSETGSRIEDIINKLHARIGGGESIAQPLIEQTISTMPDVYKSNDKYFIKSKR